MNEWIDATVEQPEPYESVLAVNSGHYCIAYVGEFWDCENDNKRLAWCFPGSPNARPRITHWMPLPPLPEKPEKVTR